MKIKLHKPDCYFHYPRACKWIDFKGNQRIQFGFWFNVEIIVKA